MINFFQDEIVGRPLQDLINSDVSLLLSQTNRLKDFDGALSFNRKIQDPLVLQVHASPVACLGKSSTTHLVLTLSSIQSGSHEMALPSIPQAKEPRGSLHSIRRGSFDVRSIASDGLRRTSLAKLSSLPLEAPITKVLSILAQVQDNCSSDEAKLLDRVIEFLKREGLYSPQIKEMRPDDSVASDLIGALLTVSLKFFFLFRAFFMKFLNIQNLKDSRLDSNDNFFFLNFTARPIKRRLIPSQFQRIHHPLRQPSVRFKCHRCQVQSSNASLRDANKRPRLGL